MLWSTEHPLQPSKFAFSEEHTAFFVMNVKTAGPWSNSRKFAIGNKPIFISFEINWTICHCHDCLSLLRHTFPPRMLLFILSVDSKLNSVFWTWLEASVSHGHNYTALSKCNRGFKIQFSSNPPMPSPAGKGIHTDIWKAPCFTWGCYSPGSPLRTCIELITNSL